MKKSEILGITAIFVVLCLFVLYFSTQLQTLTYQGANTAYLPNPTLTPGVTNPSVTQANIKSTICVSGWTATIRPTSSYTTSLKKQQIIKYKYFDTKTASYEEDHLISLELGGSPTDPNNLWPEAYPAAHLKDATENLLKEEVCNGTITLAKAQQEISQNWYAVYTSQIQNKLGSVNQINDPDDE